MTDVHSPDIRRKNMAAIKGKNTKPELLIRSALHKLGFRYSLQNKRLSGNPDLYFRKYNAVLFVHGCFWHGHGCHLFKWPKTREDFWRQKITANVERDARNIAALISSGVRVGVVWECALKGRTASGVDRVAVRCAGWLETLDRNLEIHGDEKGIPLRLF